MEETENSIGEERIGKFNPEGRKDVERIKMLSVELINAIDEHCPKGRRASHAMTLVEDAQMNAVGAIFKD